MVQVVKTLGLSFPVHITAFGIGGTHLDFLGLIPFLSFLEWLFSMVPPIVLDCLIQLFKVGFGLHLYGLLFKFSLIGMGFEMGGIRQEGSSSDHATLYRLQDAFIEDVLTNGATDRRVVGD